MGTPLSTITSMAAPLLMANIDTDQIIPSREMRSTGKTGLAKGLFAGSRYVPGSDYQPDPGFVLNDAQYADTEILLAGENFGCGSSREHAVWALAEYGIRAVIAPSFAPIFENNCPRNGVLCAALPINAVEVLADQTEAISVDIPKQTVTSVDGQSWHFDIDEEAKAMLVGGLDTIALTLKHAEEIKGWQTADAAQRPWIYL